MTPEGWIQAKYGDIMTETDERAGGSIELPVLSVTKTRGLMLASERFGKIMHGRDLSRYRIARRHAVVADPMLLWDGSIGLQTVTDVGLVSPDYRVYQAAVGVDPQFLGYVIRSSQMLPHYQGGARGTNVRRNRIARGDFLAIPLSLPPLREQKKIAAIISALGDSIESSQAVIDQLQVVKKSMMAELLTRGIPGRHTKFKMTEIGEVPEEWDVVPLGSLLKVGPDNGIYKAQSEYGEGAPIVRIDGFNNGDIIRANKFRSVRLSKEETERFKLNSNDILINRVNSLSHLAKAALVAELSQPTVFESNMMRLSVDASCVSPRFVFRVISSPAAKDFFLARAKQAVAQASVNQQDVCSLPIPLPCDDEQTAVETLFNCVDQQYEKELDILAALRTLKSALVSALLSGELRVTPTEATP